MPPNTETMAAGKAPFASVPRIAGGRYGLSSKEFNAGMILALYDEMKKGGPKNHFTIGITDDVTHTSIPFDPNVCLEDKDTGPLGSQHRYQR